MGKHKPIYDPSTDCGDYVVCTGLSQLHTTGKKMQKKKYYSHTTRPGSLKEITMERMMEKWGGGEILRRAVRGMLPKNRLRDDRMARLKCKFFFESVGVICLGFWLLTFVLQASMATHILTSRTYSNWKASKAAYLTCRRSRRRWRRSLPRPQQHLRKEGLCLYKFWRSNGRYHCTDTWREKNTRAFREESVGYIHLYHQEELSHRSKLSLSNTLNYANHDISSTIAWGLHPCE